MRSTPLTSAPQAWVRAGAILGAALALGLSLFDAVVPPGVCAAPTLARTLWLAPGLVGLLVPLGAVVGAGLGLLWAGASRVGPRALGVLGATLFAGWLVAALAYGGYWAWRSGGVQLEIRLGRAVALAVLGTASFVVLAAAVRWLAGERARRVRRAAAASCLAGWLVALVAGAVGVAGSDFPVEMPVTTATRPNIVLVVVDTLRADHLSCYGYDRETTPNLDAFARGALRYTNVVSPGSWTLPSHASLFTGLPSSVHGCNWSWPELDEELVTLAELLQAAGYQTVGLSSNGFLNPENGFAQGFDTFYTPWSERSRIRTLLDRGGRVLGLGNLGTRDADSRATIIHRRLGRWLREDYDPSRPYFIFLNYLETHAPYLPVRGELGWSDPETVRRWAGVDQASKLFSHTFSGGTELSGEQIGELVSLYDDTVRYVDSKVGELLTVLGRGGDPNGSLIAITSDHGEHFGGHGVMEHQYSVYEPLVRAPLLVRYSQRLAPGVDHSLVQTHDLFATVLEAAGVTWERQPGQTSRSLFDTGRDGDRLAVAEYVWPNIIALADRQRRLGAAASVRLERFMRRLRAVQRGPFKLIRASDGSLELYDLDADRTEQRDLAAERPELTAALAEALDDWLAALPTRDWERWRPGADSELARSRLEELRSLGYLR